MMLAHELVRPGLLDAWILAGDTDAMNSTSRDDTRTTSLIPRLWTGLSDDLRERRRHRAARVALRSDLAAYNSQGEVEDLLGALRTRDDSAAEEIRSILTSNLVRRKRSSHLAG